MEKEKIENTAKKFLDAWVENKSYDLNKKVVTKDIDVGARRQFFKDVLLRSYKVISYSVLSDILAVIKVQMHVTIRGKMQNKRLLIYAVKVKNDWKIDITSLIVH